MKLDDIDNPRTLSFEDVLEILEEELYQDLPEDSPYRPLNFHDNDED